MVRACISVFEEIDLPLALENRWLDLYNELDIQQTLQQSTCLEPDEADEVDEPAEPAELAEVDISDLPIFDGDMGAPLQRHMIPAMERLSSMAELAPSNAAFAT